MTSTDDPSSSVSPRRSVVTQMYTFSSLSKQKTVENGHYGCSSSSSMLPYVGFPGLSLTPIPESPLLDSALGEDADLPHQCERDRCRQEDPGHFKVLRNGALPPHWLSASADSSALRIEREEEEAEGAGGKGPEKALSPVSKKTCSVQVHVVQTTTFLPKEQPLTREEKRAHLCKLLLFALCGFVIVAGIVLWIFSPAFT